MKVVLGLCTSNLDDGGIFPVSCLDDNADTFSQDNFYLAHFHKWTQSVGEN